MEQAQEARRQQGAKRKGEGVIFFFFWVLWGVWWFVCLVVFFWGDFKCFYFTVCFSESTFMLKVVSLGGMTRDRDFSGCSGRGFGSLNN